MEGTQDWTGDTHTPPVTWHSIEHNKWLAIFKNASGHYKHYKVGTGKWQTTWLVQL